ncbi:MAG: glycosyltransferase family 4 protein, partial [Chloroflexi bacterium]
MQSPGLGRRRPLPLPADPLRGARRRVRGPAADRSPGDAPLRPPARGGDARRRRHSRLHGRSQPRGHPGHGRPQAARAGAGAARLKKRRLALLHYTAPPVTGGVEAILGEHRRLLTRAGHDVQLLAGRGDATLVPELDSRHPEVEALYEALRRGQAEHSAFESLRERIKQKLAPLLADRDLVIAHNVATMPFNLPLAAALAGGPWPVLHWVHDLAWLNAHYRAFHREGEPYDLLHRAQPDAAYVAISEVRGRDLQQLLGVEAEVIPNGIDFDQFLGIRPATRSLLRAAGLDRADPLVLVPLRVTRRKRLELALEAAALLRERLPRLMLAVSGPLGPHAGDNRNYQQELFELRARLELD